MKKKIKLRYLTKEQYKKWQKENCEGQCDNNCCFNNVSCMIPCIDCWVNHKDLYSDKFLDQEIEIEVDETFKLTEDEKAILRNIDIFYKYIARNSDDTLTLFEERPYKNGCRWWGLDEINSSVDLTIFSHLFQFIKWEDFEPYSIEELLKEEKN